MVDDPQKKGGKKDYKDHPSICFYFLNIFEDISSVSALKTLDIRVS